MAVGFSFFFFLSKTHPRLGALYDFDRVSYLLILSHLLSRRADARTISNVSHEIKPFNEQTDVDYA